MSSFLERMLVNRIDKDGVMTPLAAEFPHFQSRYGTTMSMSRNRRILNWLTALRHGENSFTPYVHKTYHVR